MEILEICKKKPEGYEEELSDFGPVIWDSSCGETIGWGFKIVRHMPEERFNYLRRFGSLECCYPNWYLVTRELTFEDAEELYGKLNHVERGPRGGYKWSQFGDKKFFKKFEIKEKAF